MCVCVCECVYLMCRARASGRMGQVVGWCGAVMAFGASVCIGNGSSIGGLQALTIRSRSAHATRAPSVGYATGGGSSTVELEEGEVEGIEDLEKDGDGR